VKCGVEIEIKALIQDKIVFCHLRHVNLVIPVGMHLAKRVLIEEVVADHQTLLIFGERKM
jgi:hypothetical protein